MVDQRNETVIATGSSCLIGAPVLRRLARSFRAVGFDRESNPPPPREAECVCVDIGSEQSVWDGLDRVRYAYGDLIAEPEAPSYGELQEELGCLIHGEEWKAREVPESVARAGAWLQDKAPLARESFIKRWMVALAEDDYELDITRARRLLGWEPQHSLHETLPKMAAALKADRPRLYRANKLDPPPWLEYVAAQAAAPERTG